MRAILVGAIWLAACGGGGGGSGAPDPMECQDDASTFHAATTGRQTCIVDSDCTIVVDHCFGNVGCATYANRTNAATAAAALADAKAAGCACNDGECLQPPPPICSAGICAMKPTH